MIFDFRLKVFDTVARRLNFTKAANELNITQPAVTKHIKEIELTLKIKLFERNGTKIKLTVAGHVLLKHTEQIFAVYQQIDFEIAQLNLQKKGFLRVGASTTIAQYVLPAILADFHKRFPEIKIQLVTGNSEKIEELLTNNKIELGLIEGNIKNRIFHYFSFQKDEIVLVSKSVPSYCLKNQLDMERLKSIPLIMREPGSGTLETIGLALKANGVKISELNVEMQLANTESIKSYLLHSNAFAFLSIHSILQELKSNFLVIIDVENLEIQRDFSFIIHEGEQSQLVKLFVDFASQYHF